MTGPMSLGDQQELIAGYVLGDLSLEESAMLRQLIADNPAIAQDIEQLQQTLELVYAPAEAQPPSHLRDSLLNAHRTASSTTAAAASPAIRPAPLPERPEWSHGSSRDPRRKINGWGAIAALLIAGLGISNYVTWRSLQALRADRQASDFVTVSLSSAEESTTADGAVTVELNSANLEALLEAELPPLPEGQVYVLWTVLQPEAPFTTDDKGAILTHVFTGGDQGESITLPPVYRDSRWIKAIAVTVEDAAAPQRHEASPILIEQL